MAVSVKSSVFLFLYPGKLFGLPLYYLESSHGMDRCLNQQQVTSFQRILVLMTLSCVRKPSALSYIHIYNYLEKSFTTAYFYINSSLLKNRRKQNEKKRCKYPYFTSKFDNVH